MTQGQVYVTPLKCVKGTNSQIVISRSIENILEVLSIQQWRVQIVSREPEGRYQHSIIFHWEPEGRYRCTKSVAILPFWCSVEHLWTALMPFCFSPDEIIKRAFLCWSVLRRLPVGKNDFEICTMESCDVCNTIVNSLNLIVCFVKRFMLCLFYFTHIVISIPFVALVRIKTNINQESLTTRNILFPLKCLLSI